ncbi:MAG: hypothetical protein HKL81_05050, partial [Acidimicrobiaceae bacterium]|nr:hypothetical protein [Acidimicrobiaceae bacterium]
LKLRAPLAVNAQKYCQILSTKRKDRSLSRGRLALALMTSFGDGGTFLAMRAFGTVIQF